MKTIVNKLIMVLYYFVGALALEVVTFQLLGIGFLPEYLLYDFAIVIFIGFFVYIVPNFTAQYVIFTILLLVQTILIYVNYSLYVVYGNLFSLDMLKLVGAATTAMTSDFVFVSLILQLVSVFLIIVTIGGLMLNFCRKIKINIKRHFSVYNVIILVCFQFFSLGYYVNQRNEISKSHNEGAVLDDSFLLNTTYMKLASFKKFGTFGYLTNMIYKNYDSNLKKQTLDYFNNGTYYSGVDFVDPTTNQTVEKVFGVDEGNNVIVIMMESLEWIGFGDGTYDPNIENLSTEMTPNIYSLIYGDEWKSGESERSSNDAMLAKNFYAKSKTDFSEAFGILGSYPVSQNLSDIMGKKYNPKLKAFEFAIPNVLKQKGYTTSYVHSNYISFYDRNLTHKNLGFDNVIGKDLVKDAEGNLIYTGSDLEWEHWASEGDFVNNAMNYIVPSNYAEKPFYSFYLNVSSHGTYENNENEEDCVRYRDFVRYGKENCTWNEEKRVWEIDKTKIDEKLPELQRPHSTWYQNVLDSYYETDPKLCEELLYFECGIIGLDEAIGNIVGKLKDYGIYDKTTMLLYSDHFSYYKNLSNRFKGLPKSDITSMEVNRIPMILRSPGLINRKEEFTVNDRFCSAYDIIPTLLDLLGISFNENFYLGHSIFRPADYVYEFNGEMRDMVIYYSNTGGLMSRDIYSFDLISFYKADPKVDEKTLEMFKAECKNILFKINYINILSRQHLYNKLNIA